MNYGAFYEVEPQLNDMGYTLGEKRELVDQLHHGLVINHIHGIMTDGMYRDALERLNEKVAMYARPIGGKDE